MPANDPRDLGLPFEAYLVPRTGPRAGVRVALVTYAADGALHLADFIDAGVPRGCQVEIFWRPEGFFVCDLAATGVAVVCGKGRAPVRHEPVALVPGVVLEIGHAEFLFERGHAAHALPDPRLPVAFLRLPDGGAVRLGPTTVLGRHPDSRIQLLHVNVSRRHAVVLWSDDENAFVIRHMSTNPTFVNGAQVPPGGRRLASGDRIRIATLTLTFEIVAPRASG